jgi:CDP-diglyceride synthetase
VGGFCGGLNGIEGIGIINLLLVIALIAWEGMAIAGVDIKAPRALVSAGLAGGIVLFTLLKILVDNEFIAIFAWIGGLLALAIGYGGWMRWQEHQAGATSGGTTMGPPPTDTGGFTS